jgi:hypothetical protein
MNDDTLVSVGGAVKSLGRRGFSGLAIIFNSIDRTGESFSPEVNMELKGRSSLPTYWRHSLDEKIGNQKLADANFEVTSQGLHVEGEFLRFGGFEKDLMSAIDQGLLGFSTGSASHLVRTKQRGGFTEIVAWPVVDLSLTETPCEPKARVQQLKSLPPEFSLKALLANHDFNERAEAAKQRAAEIYAQTLMRDLEMRMYELRTGA